MIGWLGTIALASHQVMLAISQFTFMMYYGMGAAVAVRVSNFKGQNDIFERSSFGLCRFSSDDDIGRSAFFYCLSLP